MKSIKSALTFKVPDMETTLPNFTFSVLHDDGEFTFLMRFFNGSWNCWVTLPNGQIQQAGIYPNVVSWSEGDNYGLLVKTDLSTIDFSSIDKITLVILTWQ